MWRRRRHEGEAGGFTGEVLHAPNAVSGLVDEMLRGGRKLRRRMAPQSGVVECGHCDGKAFQLPNIGAALVVERHMF